MNALERVCYKKFQHQNKKRFKPEFVTLPSLEGKFVKVSCLISGKIRFQSVEKAKELLIEANADLEDERINSAVIVAYLSIFHAARALLFKDGYREKSHECIVRYLEEKYSKELGEKIDLLDKFKSERMHTQYDVSYSPSEVEAEKMIEFAQVFIESVEELV